MKTPRRPQPLSALATPLPRRAALGASAVAGVGALGLLAGCGTGTGTTSDAGASTGAGASDAGASDGTATLDPSANAAERNSGVGAGSESASAAISALLDSLTPREAAAQLVLVGVPAGTAPALEDPVGGYFLLGKWEQEADVRSAIGAATDAGFTVPPLLAVDQEGGKIRVLRFDGFPKVPSAADLGAEGPEAVAEHYSTLATSLSDLGFHLNFAPVADVLDDAFVGRNAPVGDLDRSFGSDPEAVAMCVETAVSALDSGGVGATLKHFPGLGRVEENTDFSASGITDTDTTPDDPALAAFAAGIDAEADAVMLSTAAYELIDPGTPAIHSRVIVTDMLRSQFGFGGVAMTDDVGSAASVQDMAPGERATGFLAAGGDVTLTADPALATEIVDAIEAWAGEHPEDFRAALTRWLVLKERRGLLPAAPPPTP